MGVGGGISAKLALAGAAALVVVAAGVWLLAKEPSKAPDEVRIKEPPKTAASNGTKPKAARREAYVVLEIDQPGAEVLVDGRYMKVEVLGDNKPVQIKATPGMHTLRVCKKDFTDVTQNIEWKTDEAPSIRVHLEAVEKRADAKPIQPDPVPDPTEKTADGFVPLFNGKDLTGWNKKGTTAMEWKVADSLLVGENKSNRYGSDTGGYLITERTDYGNFHLRFETMLSEGISSHIIFRQKSSDLKPGGKFAYWVLLGSVNPGARYQIPGASGTLYENHLGGPRPLVANAPDLHLKAGEWFQQEIIAEGSRLRVLIKGTPVVDYVDTQNPLSRGSICLNCASFCTLRCRKIEIKELPAAKPETPSAAKPEAPPPRPVDSALPPEAKAAAKAFEKSCADARAKLLAEFDTALDRLAKSKGSTEQRLKLIDAVKEEKKRFENGGLIPWSEPMRPFLAKYFASTSDAESKVRRAYNALIDAQLRAKNENMVAGLRADLSNLRAARVMARWSSFRDGRYEFILSLYSNGRIGGINSPNTWTYGNGVLILRFPNPMAPGGVWIATLKVSADGTMYAGTNNDRNRPKFTGGYVKDD